MTPEYRFHRIVVVITIFIMYLVFRYLLPEFETITAKFASTNLPVSLTSAINYLIIFIGSFGTYTLVANTLLALLRRCRPVKRYFLGPLYLEGTWVGYYRDHQNNLCYLYEHMEQDLTSTSIKGWSYRGKREPQAEWFSTAVNIDTRTNKLIYSYTCTIPSNSKMHNGLAEFNLQRPTSTSTKEFKKSAEFMKGHSTDLINGTGSPSTEKRVSAEFLPFDQALNAAQEFWDGENKRGHTFSVNP